jgi:hypothetical protein
VARLKLIPPNSSDSLCAPTNGRNVPVPQDLAEHRPIVPYNDGVYFDGHLDHVHPAAAAIVHDPMREVAVAIQALSYEEKRQVAVTLRTSVMRLSAWASLVIEAR